MLLRDDPTYWTPPRRVVAAEAAAGESRRWYRRRADGGSTVPDGVRVNRTRTLWIRAVSVLVVPVLLMTGACDSADPLEAARRKMTGVLAALRATGTATVHFDVSVREVSAQGEWADWKGTSRTRYAEQDVTETDGGGTVGILNVRPGLVIPSAEGHSVDLREITVGKVRYHQSPGSGWHRARNGSSWTNGAVWRTAPRSPTRTSASSIRCRSSNCSPTPRGRETGGTITNKIYYSFRATMTFGGFGAPVEVTEPSAAEATTEYKLVMT